MRRSAFSMLALATLLVAETSPAETRAYNSWRDAGTPGDEIRSSTSSCPPVATMPDTQQGFAILEDDGTGTVSLDLTIAVRQVVELGRDQLIEIFGPGAFIFIETTSTTVNNPPGGSVHTSAAGSSTARDGLSIWGVVSGWSVTGERICLSSPVTICSPAIVHGATVRPTLASPTFDLGTWAFDSATGDYESVIPYISRTFNGGLGNDRILLRGAFTGASIPALPLVGGAALAVSIALIGAHSLLNRN